MSITNLKFNHGDEVLVFDKHGNYECRGKIVGRYGYQSNLYDILPSRSESLANRLHAIPEHMLRRVSAQIKAYEPKKLEEPIIMMGDA